MKKKDEKMFKILGNRAYLILIIIDLILRLLSGWLIPSCNINTGVAFGINIVNEELVILVVLVALSVYLLFFLKKGRKDNPLRKFIPMLIALGSVNFIDRLIRGGVCDYIRLDALNISFNLADFGISAIIIAMIYYILKYD